jgi:Excalibur calcium-binding domain
MMRAPLVAAAIAAATIGAAPLAGAVPTTSPSPTLPSSLGPPYADCAAAIAAGKQNIPIGDPAYRSEWDHDGDGFACESSDDSE